MKSFKTNNNPKIGAKVFQVQCFSVLYHLALKVSFLCPWVIYSQVRKHFYVFKTSVTNSLRFRYLCDVAD